MSVCELERGWPTGEDENRQLTEPVCGFSLLVNRGHAERGRKATKAAEGNVRLRGTASNPSSKDQLRLATVMGIWRRKEDNQVGNLISKAKGY